MRCQGVQNQLSDYLANKVDRYQREAIDRHLRVCAACRADLNSLRQMVSILTGMPAVSPSEAVRNTLAQKIRAVRQPMSFMERLRMQWQVAGMGARARQWGVGMAATILIFSLASFTRGLWQTPATELDIGRGPGIAATRPAKPEERVVPRPNREAPAADPAPAATERSRPAVVPGAPNVGLRVKGLPEQPMVVGQPADVYLAILPEQNLDDVEVIVFPPTGVTLLGNPRQRSDGSYLLRRGPVVRGDAQSQWVPIELCPTTEGLHTLRAVFRQAGHVIAQKEVPFHVAPSLR